MIPVILLLLGLGCAGAGVVGPRGRSPLWGVAAALWGLFGGLVGGRLATVLGWPGGLGEAAGFALGGALGLAALTRLAPGAAASAAPRPSRTWGVLAAVFASSGLAGWVASPSAPPSTDAGPAPAPAPAAAVGTPCTEPSPAALRRLAALRGRVSPEQPVLIASITDPPTRAAIELAHRDLRAWIDRDLTKIDEVTDIPRDVLLSAAARSMLEPYLSRVQASDVGHDLRPFALIPADLRQSMPARAVWAHVDSLLDPARLAAAGHPPVVQDAELAEELAMLGEVLGDDLEGLCTAPLTDDEAWDVLLALLEFHAEAQELPAFWTLPEDQRDPWRWAPLEPLCACER